MSFTPMECAKAIEQAYKGRISYQKKKFISDSGAEAYLNTKGLMVIPGSQGIDDYLKFNLRVGWFKMTNKNSKIKFHAGFMKHASDLLDFARTNNVKMITGHSLGAASGQLIAATLNIDAYCFAAPKVLYRGWKSHTSARIFCINRKDDTVCRLPSRRFKHIGKVIEMTARGRIGADHKIKHYMTAMNTKSVQNASSVRFV